MKKPHPAMTSSSTLWNTGYKIREDNIIIIVLVRLVWVSSAVLATINDYVRNTIYWLVMRFITFYWEKVLHLSLYGHEGIFFCYILQTYLYIKIFVVTQDHTKQYTQSSCNQATVHKLYGVS